MMVNPGVGGDAQLLGYAIAARVHDCTDDIEALIASLPTRGQAPSEAYVASRRVQLLLSNMLVARWLITGESLNSDEAEWLAQRGMFAAAEGISIVNVARGYFCWRDVLIRYLEEEIERLQISAVAARAAVESVRRSSDASIIRMSQRFQEETERLREVLRSEREAYRGQALRDPLTDLHNRACFRDDVATALLKRDLAEHRPAVLFIDVDDFKRVNDGVGHDIGDRLLVEVAARLRGCVRPEDIVGRLGGDEFAILVAESAEPAVVSTVIAGRVIESMRAPFEIAGHVLDVDVSIGIACFDAQNQNVDELLREADIAMYRAKSQGKARYELFSESLQTMIDRRIDVEVGLRRAVEFGEIKLRYQPIVSLPGGEIEMVEALVRWEHPTRGTLPPSEFLQVAQETGLIVPIGRIVLREACNQFSRWRGRLPDRDLRVTVNLSSAELRSAAIVSDVTEALARAGLPPGALVIEVTESVLLDEVDRVAGVLRQLRGLGVLIAIDDFGAGYSALSHLTRLPCDILKIDRSFIDGICRSDDQAALTGAVLSLGRALKLQLVAEGVEDREQAEALTALACGHAQGYFYSRPVDASGIDELLPRSHRQGQAETSRYA